LLIHDNVNKRVNLYPSSRSTTKKVLALLIVLASLSLLCEVRSSYHAGFVSGTETEPSARIHEIGHSIVVAARCETYSHHANCRCAWIFLRDLCASGFCGIWNC